MTTALINRNPQTIHKVIHRKIKTSLNKKYRLVKMKNQNFTKSEVQPFQKQTMTMTLNTII